MIRSFYTAAAGMLARQAQVDTLADNLANISTPGYKRAGVRFAEVLAGQAGSGVRVAEVARDHSPGPLLATGAPFDLAIQGEGYFRLRGAEGTEAYARAGVFGPTPDGWLAAAGGHVLQGTDGPLQVPAGAERLLVRADGSVVAQGPGALERPVGRVALVRFRRPELLRPLGQNLWGAPPGAEPAPGAPGEPGFGQVAAGALEQPNTSLADEMVDLLMAQRYYQLNTRALQLADELVAMATELRRG